MKVLALDVGQTTGFAVGEVTKGKLPVVDRMKPIDFRDIDEERISGILVEIFNQWVNPFAVGRASLVVAEMPANDPFSSGAKQTQEIAKLWYDAMKEWSDEIRVVTISPSQWKSTPSATAIPMCSNYYQQFDHALMKPTKHEEDAVRILHWLAFFGNSVLTSEK